jgi:hypothetical protein
VESMNFAYQNRQVESMVMSFRKGGAWRSGK